jgi:type IV fimbrial biogenesis protein FimT
MTTLMHPRRRWHRFDTQVRCRIRGFTLVELMITITVMAILLGVAVPSFNDALLGSKLGSYANRIVASANLARSEAIKRNSPITLCVSTNGTGCTSGGWQSGWLVGCETDDNVACKSGGTDWLVLHREQAVAGGVRITETGSALTSIAFQPTGVGAAGATLKICRATPSAGTQERVVTITATGRASVAKTTAGSCA